MDREHKCENYYRTSVLRIDTVALRGCIAVLNCKRNVALKITETRKYATCVCRRDRAPSLRRLRDVWRLANRTRVYYALYETSLSPMRNLREYFTTCVLPARFRAHVHSRVFTKAWLPRYKFLPHVRF